MTEKYSTVCMYDVPYLLYPFICWSLEYMCLLELWFSQGICLVVGLLGHMGHIITSFFFKNLCTVVHNGYFSFFSHQRCRRDSYSPAFIVCRVFLMVTIPTGVRWYIIVMLLCITLIITDGEHLSMCLLAICMSSLEKCLFRSSAYFLIGLFFWYQTVWAD